MISEHDLRTSLRDEISRQLASGVPDFTTGTDTFEPVLDEAHEAVSSSPGRRALAGALVAATIAVGIVATSHVIRADENPAVGDAQSRPAVHPTQDAAALAPIVQDVTPDRADPWDTMIFEALGELVEENGSTFTYATTTDAGDILIGTPSPTEASKLVEATLDELGSPAASRARVHVERTSKSGADLEAIVHDVAGDAEASGVAVASMFIDRVNERVVLRVSDAPDEYRRHLYALFGRAVAIEISTATPDWLTQPPG